MSSEGSRNTSENGSDVLQRGTERSCTKVHREQYLSSRTQIQLSEAVAQKSRKTFGHKRDTAPSSCATRKLLIIEAAVESRVGIQPLLTRSSGRSEC